MATDQPLNLHANPTPVCPHCGYAMNPDDMSSAPTDSCQTNLFDIAPAEESTSTTCPACDGAYWVKGGYQPTYTTAFAEEEL